MVKISEAVADVTCTWPLIGRIAQQDEGSSNDILVIFGVKRSRSSCVSDRKEVPLETHRADEEEAHVIYKAFLQQVKVLALRDRVYGLQISSVT